MLKECIYCANKKLYTLSNGYKKCPRCKKKFSPKKYETKLKVIDGFCKDKSANKLSKQLGINYMTVSKVFQQCRIFIAQQSQNSFETHEHYIQEYDEYLYLPRYKKSNPDSIYDAQNFLIFDYGKIYTLTLPFASKFAQLDKDPQELKNFLRQSKIAKLRSSLNSINEFCLFFEENIKRYKGVSEQNFHYYLKEIEFKFNYEKKMRYNLLLTEFVKSI